MVELWCALDTNVCLLMACLPPLRPYLRLIGQSSFFSRTHKHPADVERGNAAAGAHHPDNTIGKRCSIRQQSDFSTGPSSSVHNLNDSWEGGPARMCSDDGRFQASSEV
ncbi:hypothetical protein AUP68_02210 [Ilyonectria robusta]